MKLQIGKRAIGDSEPCFIIAEAGVNHNGDIALAKKLVDIAIEAGVDAVKFQTWVTSELVVPSTGQAEYQKKNTGTSESQFDMIKKLELSYDSFTELKQYCDMRGILFLSTPDEERSMEFLYALGVSAFKIGSGELTNHPYLEKVAEKNIPIILSTGMSSLSEVLESVRVIRSHNTQLALLHCTSEYPAPLDSVNLRAMHTLQQETNLIVGYSDHTEGILVSALAVAMGAKILEKHFTYDKNAPGPDHAASLTPEELKEMVALIRKTELIMGSAEKKSTAVEAETRAVVTKSIVAAHPLSEGTILTENALAFKRAGHGIDPRLWKTVLGKRTKKHFVKDEVLTLENLE